MIDRVFQMGVVLACVKLAAVIWDQQHCILSENCLHTYASRVSN